LIEFPRVFKQSAPPERKRMAANAWRLGYVDGAVGDAELVARLAALFPDVVFESVGAAWPDSWPSQLDILIVSVDGASPAECECTLRRLRTRPPALHVVVVVRRANTIDTRVIARYGASDVLAAPVSEAALALSIERLLARDITLGGAARRPGQMVALLKAGGGVGANVARRSDCGVACGEGAAGCTGVRGRSRPSVRHGCALFSIFRMR